MKEFIGVKFRLGVVFIGSLLIMNLISVIGTGLFRFSISSGLILLNCVFYKKFIHFIYIIKLIGMKFFFNVCVICSCNFSFISDVSNFCYYLFFLQFLDQAFFSHFVDFCSLFFLPCIQFGINYFLTSKLELDHWL